MRTFAIIVFCSIEAHSRGADYIPMTRTAIYSAQRAHELVSVCLDPPSGLTSYWTPTEKDVMGIETNLIPYLQQVNPPIVDWFRKSGEKLADGWPWFRRQIAGVKRGEERFLLIHCRPTGIRETGQKRAKKRGSAARF
jgi:hypothetical protein